MSRFARLLLAAVLLTCGLAGCGSAADLLTTPAASTAPPSKPAPTTDPAAERRDKAAAQAVLDARAKALLDGDREAFLAQLDSSDERFVEEQTLLFDNIQKLPFAVLEYDVAELLPEQNVSGYDERVLLPRTVLRYRFQGYDPASATIQLLYTLVLRDGEWRITSDDDIELDAYRREVWEFGRIHVADTGRLLVVSDREGGSSRRAQALGLARGAVQTITRALPVRWDRKLVVYATSEADLYQSYGFLGPNVAAITVPLTASRRGEQPVVRVLVNPDLPRIDPVTFTHEATHVAMTAYPDIPTWLNEGIAEYVGDQAGSPARQDWPATFVSRAQEPNPMLAESNGFYAESDVGWNYAHSWMACDYIADRYGSAMLVRLAHAMNTRPDLYSLDQQQDAVLIRLLGIDGAQLAQAASDRLVRRFG